MSAIESGVADRGQVMKTLLRSGLTIAALAAAPAMAADLTPAYKAPPPGCVQAVDGLNGKADGSGGTFADRSVYMFRGSFSMPIQCQFGLQIDGGLGSLENRFFGYVGGHGFWRDPSRGLVGLYGAFQGWNQVGGVRVAHVGPEAEYYFGRWTFQGVVGVEFGNTATGLIGNVIQTFDYRTRFFDQFNVAYYPIDNWKVFAGHRYLGGKNAFALGTEWGMPLGRGMMGALYAEGRIGEGDYHGIWGGFRVYFGQKDKTLIRRHREDDPVDWVPHSITNPGTKTPTGGSCCPSGPTTQIKLEAGTQLAENIDDKLMMLAQSCSPCA